MAAFSTKGLTVWLQKLPGSSPAPVTVSNVTNSKPAVITVGSTAIDDFARGDLVTITGTGMSALDGRTFTVGTVDDTAYTLALSGSDSSGATAPSTTGSVTNLQADLTEFCVATVEHQQSPAQSISVGTTCDPSAQIAGEPQAGTLSVTGFVDYAKEGFLEFLRAVDDQQPRAFVIRYPPSAVPSGYGALIFPSVTATGFTESYGVNAAGAFTGEFTLGTKPIRVTE